MSLIRFRIDGREAAAEPGTTLWEAARRLSIDIPTLCHRVPYEPVTSCMICVVEDVATGRLLPACSMPAAEGMNIATDSAAVREARKAALELLLSEHVGDCEAPCRRACPAYMDIPQMNRQIARGRPEAALATIRRDIALPAVLGRICPAPCEKACHRRAADGAVHICHLKRFAADADLASSSPFRPDCRPPSGKKVAILGAGPAGLSAAYYLQIAGHGCRIFDRHPLPGGALRYGVPPEALDRSVLDAEIGRILALGALFHGERTLGQNLTCRELLESFDAIVLAMGSTEMSVLDGLGVEVRENRVVVARGGHETGRPGIYAGGNMIGEGKMAIRAAAHGKAMAAAIDRSWHPREESAESVRRFHSVIGRLQQGEPEQFLQEAIADGPLAPPGGFSQGYPDEMAAREAARCYQCDCRKKDCCLLRIYAGEYGSQPRRFKYGRRRSVRIVLEHPRISHEPGKCIRCGLCVRIAKAHEEEIGLAFVGRGFDMRVEAPFGESLDRALVKCARECAESCPTAALAFRERLEK